MRLYRLTVAVMAACPPSPVVGSVDRRLGRLEVFQTFFFVCDMQDGFRQYNIQSYREVVFLAQQLVRYVHKFMIKYSICVCCKYVHPEILENPPVC